MVLQSLKKLKLVTGFFLVSSVSLFLSCEYVDINDSAAGDMNESLSRANSAQLITNPGFESGVSGWTGAGGATVVSITSPKNSGSKALKLQTNGATSASSRVLSYDITNLVRTNGSGYYFVEAMIQTAQPTTEGHPVGTVGIQYKTTSSGAWVVRYGKVGNNLYSFQYHKVYGVVNIASPIPSGNASFLINVTGVRDFYVDDVRLIKLDAAVNKPFPQDVAYTGCIKPTWWDGPQRAMVIQQYYDKWKADYYRTYPSPNNNVGYIEGPVTGSNPGWPSGVTAVSASEHTGYGMMLFAMMAGCDPDARKCFDSLFRLYMANPSCEDSTTTSKNNGMMSWVEPSQYNTSLNKSDSATDGDMDIAYALLLASKQWGGNPDGYSNTYEYYAKQMINKGFLSNTTDVSDLNLTTDYILNGDWAWGNESETVGGVTYRWNDKWLTRPSDWILDHFTSFNKAVSSTEWGQLRDKVYSIHTAAANGTTGLISDFVLTYSTTSSYPTTEAPRAAWDKYQGEPFPTSQFSENACRVPFRFAADYALSGDSRSKTIAKRIGTWISNKYTSWWDVQNTYYLNGNPYPVTAAYPTVGKKDDGALHFTSCLVSTLIVDSSFQDKLNSGFANINTRHVGNGAGKDGYFKDSLTLLSMMLITGNWWIY